MSISTYKNQDVRLFRINTKLEEESLKSSSVLRDIDMIGHFTKEKDLQLVQLLGFVCEGPGDFELIFKFDQCVSLNTILKNVKLSGDLKYSLVRDLALGISAVHKSTLQCHGDLQSNRCAVDERFVLRLMITRLPAMKSLEKKLKMPVKERDSNLLWTAPELLTGNVKDPNQSTDAYSFAVIVHEIVFQKGPFYVREIQGQKHQSKAVISEVKTRTGSVRNLATNLKHEETMEEEDDTCAKVVIAHVKKNKLRPSMPYAKKYAKIRFLCDLMDRCWDDNPQKRPTFDKILTDLHDYMKDSQIDAAFQTAKRLKSVSKTMVNELLHKKAEAIQERDKAMKYLSHMMPPRLSYELTTGGTHIEPEYSENVTIYFNDLVGFSLAMDQETAISAITSLEALFETYDKIFKNYDVVPLHRVGSSLLLASGVPYSQVNHASEVAQAALQIRQFVSICGGEDLQLRAGIHSGPVMSGIIGKNIPQYGLFGDTVNTASRMSSTGEIGEIQISESTRNLLGPCNKFILTGGNEKIIKGKDKMKTWWLKGFVGYKGMLPLDNRLDNNATPGLEKSEEGSNDEGRSIQPTGRNVKTMGTQRKTTRGKSPALSHTSDDIDLDDDVDPTTDISRRSLLGTTSSKKSRKSVAITVSKKSFDTKKTGSCLKSFKSGKK